MIFKSSYLKHLATVVTTVALCVLSSCNEEEKASDVKYDSTGPTLKSLNVSTVISDSGVTRYRATTPEWSIYSAVPQPYWDFPKGLRIEQFDTQMQTEANIYCDKAYFDVNLKLWRLDGNVKVTNRKGEKFETDQLFWDQTNAKVYSEKTIKIQQPDCIITGRGFRSNETMTNYEIDHPEGIIPLHE